MSYLTKKDFKNKTRVNNETLEKLSKYLILLETWQKKFNLISKNSFKYIWDRHFLDSYQILKLIGNKKKILDIGSGAGFPGMICAICSNNSLDLIESNKKKKLFLEEVKKKLKLNNVLIHHTRVENFKISKSFDFISARAVTSLDNLFKYSVKFYNKKTQCIFLKGKDIKKEIKIARSNFFFDISYIQSITSNKSKILVIKNLKKK